MDEKTVNQRQMDVNMLDAVYAAKTEKELMKAVDRMRAAKVDRGVLTAAVTYANMVLGANR